MLTDNCFNALAQQFRAYDKLFHRGQKLMNIMPPFIAYGYACGVHLPLVLGFTVIIIPNLDPAKLGSLVLKYKPEHMFGVPTHYQQLAADPKVQKKDLSFIHNYAAGGDAISLGAEKTVNEFLASHNVEYPMAKGYGMTEVSSAATVAAGLDNKPGSVGIPMVNTVVAAFEPGTDQELPIGQGHIDDDGVAGMRVEGRENACIECLEQTHGSLLFPAQPAKLADLVNDVVKRRTSAFASAAPKPTAPQATKEPANETCPTRRDLPDHGQGQ